MEPVTAQRTPAGARNFNKSADAPSSGSIISSERRVPHERAKNDITEPTARDAYAGCPTLLVHLRSKADLSSGRMALMSTKSPRAVLLKAMLIMFAPASIALFTALMRSRRLRSIRKFCASGRHVMYAATVRSLDDSEDLARCDAGSALELAGAARFIAAGGAKRPLREQGGTY